MLEFSACIVSRGRFLFIFLFQFNTFGIFLPFSNFLCELRNTTVKMRIANTFLVQEMTYGNTGRRTRVHLLLSFFFLLLFFPFFIYYSIHMCVRGLELGTDLTVDENWYFVFILCTPAQCTQLYGLTSGKCVNKYKMQYDHGRGNAHQGKE